MNNVLRPVRRDERQKKEKEAAMLLARDLQQVISMQVAKSDL